MNNINYHNRHFVPKINSNNGEAGASTRFHYRQQGNVVWATYEGGSISFGTLVAKVNLDGSLDMRYSHVNKEGALMAGRCHSIPEVLADGRVRLYEKWRWTNGDESEGDSVIEEVRGQYHLSPRS